jgi:septal ring factor EnvC (AmiA/AmiB activator)
MLMPLPGEAQTAGKAAQGKLVKLRDQRAALERELKAAEASRLETAEQLRATEQAISGLGRKLRALGQERAAAKAELAERERALRQLEQQVTLRQEQLARLLRFQFRPHATDALAVLLAGGDPNAAARERYFLARLSHAQADLITELRHDTAEIRRLRDVIDQHHTDLHALQQREEQGRGLLRQRQQERQDVLVKISSQIKAQRNQLASIKQDEQRLSKLIDRLAQRSSKAQAAKGKHPQPPAASARNAPRATQKAPVTLVARELQQLRGKLLRPVAGSIVQRFGTRRADGQSQWKGVLFRVAAGAEVRAVAAGEVVFADWLRGYGNLLIIDHARDLLSVYGNNQTLLAEVGQKVGAGATVATVGGGGGVAGDGGLSDSGLYFELRYQGQPFDPSRWLAP